MLNPDCDLFAHPEKTMALTAVIAVVTADLTASLHLPNSPKLFTYDDAIRRQQSDRPDLGSDGIWAYEEGQCYIGISDHLLKEVINSFQNDPEPNSAFAKLIFTLGHEGGHLHQVTHIGSKKFSFKPGTLNEQGLTNISRVFGSDASSGLRNYLEASESKYEYNRHPSELHAHAIATRYISEKRRQSPNNNFWKKLNTSEFLVEKWESVIPAVMKNTLISRYNSLVNIDPEKEIVFLRKLYDTYQQAIKKISG